MNKIPNILGMELSIAKAALDDLGFKYIVLLTADGATEDNDGKVIDQKTFDDILNKDYDVAIYIASLSTIPDVVGLSVEDAMQVLDDSGFSNVKISYEKSSEKDYSELLVSKQIPQSPQPASTLTSVTLYAVE